jgi:two-component system, OmpR family, copper resistance phosphate regulon response regulator CusR
MVNNQILAQLLIRKRWIVGISYISESFTSLLNLMNCILIVEDETRIAAFIEKGLRKQGFKTIVAEDGLQGLHIASHEKIDLLLLDLGLPLKSGWEVLEELRDRGFNFPIIIMTAFSDEQNRFTAMYRGASDYLTKPFKFQDLLAMVRSQFNSRISYLSTKI